MIQFYQNLGKLFYAIASTDGSVTPKEMSNLNDIVKSHWLCLEETDDQYNVDAAYQIQIVFDQLYSSNASPKHCYNEFEDFSKRHPSLFSIEINKLILSTATSIANAYAKVNKSELIMLAKLELHLNA